MRSLLLCALLLACAGGVLGARAGDADDIALAEIGVDLSHFVSSPSGGGYIEPAQSYIKVKPADHKDALIAKFPLLHEVAGQEAKDWSDIQSLLMREPAVAMETNMDLQLDELEKKFNEIDTMPVPSAIPPPGSTLLPGVKKEKLGLKQALPENMMRLQQLKKEMEQKAATKAQAAVQPDAAPAAAPAPATAPAATPAPAAAAPAAAPAAAAATPAAATPAAAAPAAATPAAAADAAAAPAAAAATPASEAALATRTSMTILERRIEGLTRAFQQLKSQLGVTATEEQSSAKRLDDALKKHRADKASLKKRMAERDLPRFAQRDMDDGASFAETHAEADAEHELEAFAEDALAAETEVDADAEAELAADAEAIEDILSSIM